MFYHLKITPAIFSPDVEIKDYNIIIDVSVNKCDCICNTNDDRYAPVCVPIKIKKCEDERI